MILNREDLTPWSHLESTIKSRFNLAEGVEFAVLIYDADGDELTISSNRELREHLDSLDANQFVLRFTVVFATQTHVTESPTQYHSLSGGSEHHTSSYAPSEPVGTTGFEQACTATERSASPTYEGSDGEDEFELLSDYSGSEGTDVPELTLEKGKGKMDEPLDSSIAGLRIVEPDHEVAPVATPHNLETETPTPFVSSAEDPLEESLPTSSLPSSSTFDTAATNNDADPDDTPLPT
ncbi:hypothetical protein P7C70_g5894, partial [Phenoliferia sp. Uapishka_3]